MNGPLWYSGPGISVRAVGRHQQQRRGVGIDQRWRWLRISFGRPVLPPDVIAFHGFETVSRRASCAGRRGRGSQPRGRQVEPG